MRSERRRVIAATTIGTAVEWYDYFLYAAVAGLVFNKVMFGPSGPNITLLKTKPATAAERK